DFLVKDAGVLVCGVSSVEEKGGVRFVGVDAGFNVQTLPATYGLPLEPVPVAQPAPDSPLGPVTVAGNINEALDLFGVDIPMPEIVEGDLLALLGAGGYGSSMSSRHCLRGDFTEALL
ncbi:MAG: diaminopimelate decarboxylase, partial [Acidobacteriota bacterium]